MKQKETLQLIRSRCVELLEQAKLRTPRAWEASGIAIYSLESDDRIASDVSPANATYIANASVAFEAALESTVAAIDDCLPQGAEPMLIDMLMKANETMIERIIAAWQHLLP